jgi:hypothetical protein
MNHLNKGNYTRLSVGACIDLRAYINWLALASLSNIDGLALSLFILS